MPSMTSRRFYARGYNHSAPFDLKRRSFRSPVAPDNTVVTHGRHEHETVYKLVLSQLKHCSHQIDLCARLYGIFLIDDWCGRPDGCGWYTSGLVVLGATRKQACFEDMKSHWQQLKLGTMRGQRWRCTSIVVKPQDWKSHGEKLRLGSDRVPESSGRLLGKCGPAVV